MTRSDHTLHPVLPASMASRSQALHGADASRTLEHQAQAALPPHTLMARAGLAVARLALAAWPGARTVHALAGPGNNGGDALLAASALAHQGLVVRVTLLADPERLPDDARWALAQCLAQGVAIESAVPARLDADVALDGLLGLGASRAPAGDLAAAIGLLRSEPARVLAVDLPSGLDADRGTVLGESAVVAAHTLSLLTLKPGLFTAHGRDHAGRIWLDRLGIAPSPTALALAGAPAAGDAPHASHKGTFGDVIVLGGAPGMGGAATLAARAALAAGAGRVFVGRIDPAPGTGDSVRPELMRRPLAELLAPERLHHATVVCGCGGGDAVATLLPAVLAHAARLVLDADALNAIAADPALGQRLRARAAHGRPTVLTPHPLEAARLLGQTSAQVQADRFVAVQSLAAGWACTVTLKGSGTLVARAAGRIAVNPTGNARLASPGTGDVLAGWIGGSWAHAGGDGAAAAEAAAFRHGLAAEQAPGRGPLRAAELIEAMLVL